MYCARGERGVKMRNLGGVFYANIYILFTVDAINVSLDNFFNSFLQVVLVFCCCLDLCELCAFLFIRFIRAFVCEFECLGFHVAE